MRTSDGIYIKIYIYIYTYIYIHIYIYMYTLYEFWSGILEVAAVATVHPIR